MNGSEADPAGRVALVTGGGTGIGRAVALGLARAGAAVGLIGRRPEPLQRVAVAITSLGGDAFAVPCDVTEDRQVAAAVRTIAAALGPIEILVNNAGLTSSEPVAEIDDDTLDRLLGLNLRAPYVLVREVAAGMRERGWGRIVNVASTAAVRGSRYTVLYTASKHALGGLTRSLAAALGPAGITVNALCPGFTDTAVVEAAARNIATKTGGTEDEARERLEALNPLGRLVSPEEVAQALLYLVGPASQAINGQSLILDGGTQPV